MTTKKTQCKTAVPKLKPEEMESYLSIDLETNMWVAFATLKKDIRKYKTLGWEVVAEDLYKDGTTYSMTFQAPEAAVVFPNQKTKTKRKPMTEEQKEKMRLGKIARKAKVEKEIA